ncbi:hypothetical protein IAQ61_011227 [Plenodomus lingam]|uniref:Uncharacterized protein n=1 Tax=Leptosphaeria maculans (strain JN3 / isolate v23.1.3 / race Av1-4-5-6-7-8) TaxID=985895 RepID=E5A9F8_LEPMJ|nr:hypothetical protein LEMA_P014290.1 [Plenodomus lingam JN3]KAH9859446.1 hypothetical protein IAQ61_011227 [Plenodomus lingam]CBY00299.1 hypothetical protein LEMA_P014290.1 [Plenodomus lingam JN3]
MPGLDEEAIDDILYLARTNEAAELESYLSELSEKTKVSKAELLTEAVDPYSKNTALHYAAANGHIDVIKLFIAPGTNIRAPAFINAVNDAGNTALHWAALNGHIECVKLLVEAGTDVTLINKAGHDAVFEAEINDKGDVVDWLLGAVEELETGIGQTDKGAARDEDMEDADGDGVADTDVGQADASAGSSVEGVRKQIEDMSTKQGTSKDG